jgi:TonB family protein
MKLLFLSSFFLHAIVSFAGPDSLVVRTEQRSEHVQHVYEENPVTKIKNGFYQVKYDKDILIQGNYRQGKKEGTWKYFYVPDTLCTIGHYIDGSRTGEWISYFRNGKVWVRSQYTKGQKWTEYSVWNERGQLLSERKGSELNYYYENGKLKECITMRGEKEHGRARRYYESGTLLEERFMKDGERDSVYKFYYENGQIWEHLTYKNGEEYNVIAYNDPDGKSLRCATLADGTGKMCFYDRHQHLLEEKELKNSVREGSYSKYNNGKLVSRGEYKNGKRNGRWIFCEEGVRTSDVDYADGKRDGQEINYHKSGAVAEKGMNVKGEREGEWVKMRDDGSLEGKRMYSKGLSEGPAAVYNTEEKVISSGKYAGGNKTGLWVNYDNEGHETLLEDFGSPTPLSHSETGTEDPDARVFSFAEHQPAFPGAEAGLMKFLQMNIRYPASLKDEGIKGTVVLSFVVDVVGAITEIKILKHAAAEFERESLRVLRMMPRWNPGLMNQEPVNVQYNLPVTFTLH